MAFRKNQPRWLFVIVSPKAAYDTRDAVTLLPAPRSTQVSSHTHGSPQATSSPATSNVVV